MRFRVTARGGVAVVMKPVSRRSCRGACSDGRFWADALHKSRLRAIKKAVHGIELETNDDRAASDAVESDEESWHSAKSE